MKITIRYVLGLAAVAAFATLPIYAQHGGHGSMGGAHSPTASPNNKSDSGKGGSNNTSSAIGEKLTDNTKLAGKLQNLLPAGTNLQTAVQGFKSLGQFVAAVHVSHNLGIPWDQLRGKIVGPPAESIGKAIQQLKPTANSKTETKKANDQAKQDMNDSGQSS